MNTVISGTFQGDDAVREAVRALLAEGFSSGEIASFPVVGAVPGAAAQLPPALDPDPMAVPEAESPGNDPAVGGALSGAAAGGAVGVAVGLVTLPLLGPVAAVAGVGAGAYVGSLVGALSRLGDPEHPDSRDADEEAATGAARRPGTLIAVHAREPGRRATAVRILRGNGALDLEASEGHIVDGSWVDFDPEAKLQPITA